MTFSRNVRNPGEPARISRQLNRPRSVVVRAKDSNRGPVFVGDFSVSPSDPGLNPGRAIGMRWYPRVDLTRLFVDAENAGDGVEVSIYEPASRVGRN